MEMVEAKAIRVVANDANRVAGLHSIAGLDQQLAQVKIFGGESVAVIDLHATTRADLPRSSHDSRVKCQSWHVAGHEKPAREFWEPQVAGLLSRVHDIGTGVEPAALFAEPEVVAYLRNDAAQNRYWEYWHYSGFLFFKLSVPSKMLSSCPRIDVQPPRATMT